MRDDEAQVGEVPEQVRFQELHEGGGVGVDVVGPGGVEVGVAAARHVDHRRHVQFDHLLVEGIPGLVGQRRGGPLAARRVGVEVAADEAQLVDAALQLADRMGDVHARRLRQLAHADEGLGEQVDDALDQVVAAAGPGLGHGLVAHVVRHGRGAGREHGHVRAALLDQAHLVLLDRLDDLVVGDVRIGGIDVAAGLEVGLLRLAPDVMRLGRGGVVAVAVDDHVLIPKGRGPTALE